VGAIHGVLLTAWSTAGILGPQVVIYMRQGGVEAGLPRATIYSHICWVLAVMLIVGLVANLLIRPLNPARLRHDAVASETIASPPGDVTSDAISPMLILAWLGVLIPIAWGVSITLTKAAVLFR
jgi:hypothetical protein